MNQQPQQGSGCGMEKPRDLSDIESQGKSEAPHAAPEEIYFLDEVSTKPNRKRKLPKTPSLVPSSPRIEGRDDLAARDIPHVDANIDLIAHQTPVGEENTGTCAQPILHSCGSVDTDANKKFKEITVTPCIVGGQSESEEEENDRRVKFPDSLKYAGMENDSDSTECSAVQENREFPVEQTYKATSSANRDIEENKEQLDTIPTGSVTTSDKEENKTYGENVSNLMQSKKKQISCGVEGSQKTSATLSICSAEGEKSMAVEAVMEEIYENYDSIDINITNISSQPASYAKQELQGNRLSDEGIAEGKISIGKDGSMPIKRQDGGEKLIEQEETGCGKDKEAINGKDILFETKPPSPKQVEDRKQRSIIVEESFIEHLRIVPEVEKNFPEIKVYVSVGQIEFAGNTKDVEAAALYFDNLLSSVRTSNLELRKPYIMILRKDDVREYIFKLLAEHNIPCYWKVSDNDDILVFGFSETLQNQLKSIIMNNIACETIEESTIKATAGLLKFSGKLMWWKADKSDKKVKLFYIKDIAKDIEGLFQKKCNAEKESSGIQGSNKTESMANDSKETTVGKSPAGGRNADLEYEHFTLDLGLWEFMMQQESMQKWKAKFTYSIIYNKGEVVVVGKNKTEIKKAVQELKEMVISCYVDYIVKPESLNEESEVWQSIKAEASEHNTLINTRTIVHGPLEKKTHFSIGNTDICVGHGCVSDLRNVGIMLCPVNRCLFPVTPVSELIFEKGGEVLRTDVLKLLKRHTNRHNDKLPCGFVQFSNVVGDLQCSMIAYLVVGETYRENLELENKLLSKVSHIFEEASVKKKSFIAMQLEFGRSMPVRMSSKILAGAIKKSIVGNESSLTNICLCVENIKDLEPAEIVFKHEFEKADAGDFEMIDIFEDTGDETKTVVKVEVVRGTIVNQQVDAIVCTVHESLNLRRGGLANEIYEKGGKEIEEDLLKQPKHGLGQVIATRGGNLRCKRLLFGSLPRMEKGKEDYALKNLKLFLRLCFAEAKNLGCHSIAFPLLGTGSLKYPVLTVVKEMFRNAHYYAASNFVDSVKFVLLSDGQEVTVFEELNKRFQDFQRNLGCTEDRYKYIRVKISDLKTVITVIDRVDHEAFASDVVVKPAALESPHHGGKAYAVQSVEPNPHVLNSEYYKMMLRPSPTADDFKGCLKEVLGCIYQNGYEYVTMDFSEGLDGFQNYTRLAVEVLKNCCDLLTDIQQIKIVSSEKMFEELRKLQVSSETANLSLPSKFFAKYVWPAPSVTMFLKENIKASSVSWLAVLYSTDPQNMQNTRKQIEEYYKKEKGSSVDEYHSGAKALPETSISRKKTEKSPIIETERETSFLTDEGRKPDSKQDAKIKLGLTETTLDSEMAYSVKADDEDDDEFEIFGAVKAVLHMETSSEQLYSVADILTKSDNGGITVNTYGMKTYLTFDFSQRYEVQDKLIQVQNRELPSASKGLDETPEKRAVEHLSERVIENVDEKLFQLLLLYIQEHHIGTKLKAENMKWEGNSIRVLGERDIADVVESKITALRSWNTETVGFEQNKYDKAIEAVQKLKEENPNVIIKLLENEIQINGPSEYTGPAKHRASVILGIIKPTGRRRRQMQEEYSSLPIEGSKTEIADSASSATAVASAISKQYRTGKGITVHVYKGDITRLTVDCIVNAANENLMHGGGVARAISIAAGPNFQNESDCYVIRNGKIRVTHCAATSAGSLAYKYVLHAVGPIFSATSGADSVTELENTVFNAIQLAEQLDMKSVALPSISAGIFGGDINVCAGAYARGVLKFSRQAECSQMKEIHFVDVQDYFVQKIQSVFGTEFQSTQSRYLAVLESGDLIETARKGETTSLSRSEHDFISIRPSDIGSGYIQGNIEKGSIDDTPQASVKTCSDVNRLPASFESEIVGEHSINESEKLKMSDRLTKLDKSHRGLAFVQGTAQTRSAALSKDQCTKQTDMNADDMSTFTSDTGIEIVVAKGDISMLTVDAVVCPENVSCSGADRIARSIRDALGDNLIWTKAKQNNPKLSMVLTIPTNHKLFYKYVIFVFSPRWKKGMHFAKFNGEIKEIINKVFEQSRSAGIQSLAFPLIGIGDDTTPFQTCCDTLCNEVMKRANDKLHPFSLKKIIIMSEEEGITFMCKETITNIFSTSQPSTTHSNRNKNTNPRHTEKQKCSICRLVDVSGCDTCSKCSEKKPRLKKKPPAENHPRCQISHEILGFSLPGYEECKTIKIIYKFLGGIQKECDTEPGKRYASDTRYAYLPYNEEGRLVFQLLKNAMEKGYLFKVAGRGGSISWSGLVDHKTSLSTGRYGYPDAGYLTRVRKQLADLGITPTTQHSI